MSFNLISNFGGRGVFITRKLIYIHAWGVWLYLLLLWPRVKYLTVKICCRYVCAEEGLWSLVCSLNVLSSSLTPVNITAHTGTMNLLWFNSKHQREPPNSSSSYFFVSSRYFLRPCIYGSIAYLAYPKGVKGCNRTILGSRWMNELYPHSFSKMRTSISGAFPLYLTGGCCVRANSNYWQGPLGWVSEVVLVFFKELSNK